MGSAAPQPHRGRDLDSPQEIAEFVRRFYREIAQDERFHRYFDGIARVDWYDHTGRLTDFWVAVLLGDGGPPAGDVIEAHRWLHDTEPFDVALFERWLEIFDATLEDGWRGPVAERARHRGHGLAWAMARRLVGSAPPR